MHLEVADTSIDEPSADDIRAALAVPPAAEGWSIYLSRDDDDTIYAARFSPDQFVLSSFQDGKLFEVSAHVDRKTLLDILLSYHAGDDRWLEIVTWQAVETKPGLSPSAFGNGWKAQVPLAAAAIGGLLIWFGLPLASDLLANLPWHRLPFPGWMDSTIAQLIVGFFALCALLFLVAFGLKLIEVRRARTWHKAFGRIVRSEAGHELVHRDRSAPPVNERVARIAYEFKAAGRMHRGSRVSFAERIAESEIDTVLARYPVGKTVEVFYDPGKPENSVLERDMPAGVGLGCLALLALGLVAAAGAIWLATSGPDLVLSYLPRANVPFFVFFSVAALLVFLIGLTMARTTLAARTWPSVPGTVTLSEVHAFDRRVDSTSSRPTTTIRREHMPIVEYSYQVRGKSFTSRTITLDAERSGSESFARQIADRYPVGSIVKVRYDPLNPARAALEVSYRSLVIVTAAGLLLIALAVWASGHFFAGPAAPPGR